MPVMDGYMACQWIRQFPQGKTLPIIALSAAALAQDKQACDQVGMNDHVAKPIDPKHLIMTLLKWINHSSEPPAAETAATDLTEAAAGNLMPLVMPGFDLPSALQRMDGNQALLGKLLLHFAAEYAEFALQLDGLLVTNQAVKAADLLHRLKGAAANLGGVALPEAADQLERDIRAGNSLPACGLFYKRLSEALQNIQATIRPTEPTKPKVPRSSTAVAAQLDRLADCLKHQQMLSDADLTELLYQLAGCVPPMLLDELARALHEFDYAAAQTTLNKILDLTVNTA
jgi:CheY-like chemotaxis protein